MFKWFTEKTDSTKQQTPKEEQTPQAEKNTAPAAQEEREDSTPEGGVFAGLRAAVSLTGKSIVDRMMGLLKDAAITDEDIDAIEEALLRADVGLETTTEITDRLRREKDRIRHPEMLTDFFKQAFLEILAPYEPHSALVEKPGVMNVYLIVGVNGAGKTTLIGKLAHRFIQQGRTVVIGAGDTFRAAAREQLEIWAHRAGARFVGDPSMKDPAAVIHEALRQARETGADVVLLDTAGRLQNKFNLMEELRKIRKVLEQGMPEGAHLESLLVLDATIGQNALRQAAVFKEAVSLSGVALTKLDSSAKGGVILSIAREHQLPVKIVGVGEGINDLQDFNAQAFVDALFSS